MYKKTEFNHSIVIYLFVYLCIKSQQIYVYECNCVKLCSLVLTNTFIF